MMYHCNMTENPTENFGSHQERLQSRATTPCAVP
jgi:hypothetical protein